MTKDHDQRMWDIIRARPSVLADDDDVVVPDRYFVLYNMIKARVYEAVANQRLRERIELSNARRQARKKRLKEPKEADRVPADAMLAKTDVNFCHVRNRRFEYLLCRFLLMICQQY